MIRTPLKVIVGQWYRVPCVKGSDGGIYPVVGPAHSDGVETCQKPTVEHYHLDYRFFEQVTPLLGFIAPVQEPFYRKLKCVREHSDNGSVRWALARLTRLFQSYQLDLDYPICPHRQQVIVNADGKCPGHGLCWNMQTGRLKFQPPFYLRVQGQEEKSEYNEQGYTTLVGCTSGAVTVEILDASDQLVDSELVQLGKVHPSDEIKLYTNCSERQ